jgi:CubicO group peptidase (beta-lactamase class C family)
LALRAGVDYETLVRSRIGEPLGMKSTGITLSSEMKARLAVGHNAALDAAPNWDLPTLAGAGALRSSANDMLAFLAAVLGYTESRLSPAVAATLAARKPTPVPDLEIALGWHVWLRGGKEVIWHNGGTGGYRSFAGFDPKARVGVVVLSNTFTPAGVDDIGRHLLDSQSPLLEPPKQRQEISVDPELFDRYVGRYQLAPTFILTITREGDRLFAQATGQGKAEIFAESEREFFYKIVNAQLTFEVDGEGRATQLTLHQNGRHMPAKRIE